MFSRIKRLFAIVAFSFLTANSFAAPVDLGMISSPGHQLFQGISANIDGTFSSSWVFSLEDSSVVSIAVDSFDLPGVFSVLDPLDLTIDFAVSSTPGSFSGILGAGTHQIDVFGLVNLENGNIPGLLNGAFGSIGVTPPVPELSTYAMMFMGAGFVGFATRKKKQRTAANNLKSA